MKAIYTLLCAAAAFLPHASSNAATLTTLARFDLATTGGAPFSGLVRDSDGTFYGTTNIGGSTNNGTIFSIREGGPLNLVVNFDITNGANPRALTFGSNGVLYGTTISGGAFNSGTVFRLTTNVQLTTQLTTLVNFDGENGAGPVGGLTFDESGTLYGTTSGGGPGGWGTVFSLTSGGAFSNLASFDLEGNGGTPNGRLTRGPNGQLYGATSSGGEFGWGTLFSVSDTGTLTTLANFDGSNGRYGIGGFVFDSSGVLYGTTQSGGAGYGNIFKFSHDGNLTSLFDFDGNNGHNPWGGLIADAAGALYGTTIIGGHFNSGTIFRISQDGDFSTLHHFNSQDGERPYGSLTADELGNLYGTTSSDGVIGFGTVFKLSGTGFAITAPGANPAPGAVPEPASWAMLIVGFGVVGAAARRRRQVVRIRG